MLINCCLYLGSFCVPNFDDGERKEDLEVYEITAGQGIVFS